MRRAAVIALVLGGLAAAAGGGYWFGQRRTEATGQTDSPAVSVTDGRQGHDHSLPAAPPARRKVLYYKDPSGHPDFSAEPKKDAAGRDFVPVFEDDEAPLAPPSPQRTDAAHAERKVLYYRNPMGLPDTSPSPKKDSMGMDYLPVYADEAGDDTGVVRVSPARVQTLGVRSEQAALRTLTRPVRAVGTVQFSERQQAVVSTRFEGWIETLYVNATGEPIRRGAPLMRIYSPVLVQTQQEYIDARAMADRIDDADAEGRRAVERLAEGALQRLRYLDVPEAELQRLQRERRFNVTITWPAPFSGIVLEKAAFEGMRFMPGDALYRIAGTSPIWVIAEVFEQDLAQVAVGQLATVTVKAYPDRRYPGRITFIYPDVGSETRTARVRVELPNPRGELKAEMLASVDIDTPAAASKVVSVPDSAVIDNGVRQVVLIDRGEGRFEPRPVRPGVRADGYTEIREGVAEGERVVVSATFLIDAESNLKAALAAFTAGEHEHR